MRIRTFVIGYVLALALLLFAQRRGEPQQPGGFSSVVDLTKTAGATYGSRLAGTRIVAPAQLNSGLWTVDQIPAERLIAPLVVIDVSASSFENSDYQLSVEDIASWEKMHGHIPLGAIVVARTGWDPSWNGQKSDRSLHYPGYSEDAARFLVDGRRVLGLGIDTASLDPGSTKVSLARRYALEHSVYPLENVANLNRVPATGSVAVVAPMKVAGGTSGPVRVLALLH